MIKKILTTIYVKYFKLINLIFEEAQRCQINKYQKKT